MKAIWFRAPKTASTSVRAALLGLSDLYFERKHADSHEFECDMFDKYRTSKRLNADGIIRIMSDHHPLDKFPGKYLSGDFPSKTHICQVNGEQWWDYSQRYKAFFEDAYKFTQCRHPLSRFVSSYNYVLQYQEVGFKEALSLLLSGSAEKNWRPHTWTHTRPQICYIPNRDGQLLVDRLIRFENLQNDFSAVCSDLGIPKIKLPTTRKAKDAGKPYMDYYDDESEAMAREYFKEDFELLGYK